MSIAIITGASTGIGRELVPLFAQKGYDLVLIARNQTLLDAVAETVRKAYGRKVQVIAKDLSDPQAPVEIFQSLSAQIAEIEILVNNAGIGLCGKFDELDASAQMGMLGVNVVALTHLTRLFLPGMVARKNGKILNVASTAAFQPGPLMAVYFASKAYVLSFSEAIQNELKGRGVTVTTLCPGATATEFQKRAAMDETPLFKGPGIMDAHTVAQLGFTALMQGESVVITGSVNRLGAFLTRFVPRSFAANIARRLQEIET